VSAVAHQWAWRGGIPAHGARESGRGADMDLGSRASARSSPAAPRGSVARSPTPSPMKAPASPSVRATATMSRSLSRRCARRA
jgi:hypothetical protein